MSDISATATVAELNAQLAEAEAEIERLRGVEKDAAEWVEERTKRIRADNALLRAALRDVLLTVDELKAGTHKSEVTGVVAIGVIARLALEGKA